MAPWTLFPDLDERIGNNPSASASEWPSFTNWPQSNAHPIPKGHKNWTLNALFFNMPRWTHNDNAAGATGASGTAALRIAGTPGGASVSMVAQLFRPREPSLARIDLWLRLTASAQPKMPYLSYLTPRNKHSCTRIMILTMSEQTCLYYTIENSF